MNSKIITRTAGSDFQPPREEIISEAITIVKKVRKHIQQDSCRCCKEALEN